MIKRPWKTDDPEYPDFLQKEFVGYVFRILHPFKDNDIEEFTIVRRMMWKMKRAFEEKQASRLELVHALIAIKKLKIEAEKRTFQAQIERLNSL